MYSGEAQRHREVGPIPQHRKGTNTNGNRPIRVSMTNLSFYLELPFYHCGKRYAGIIACCLVFVSSWSFGRYKVDSTLL